MTTLAALLSYRDALEKAYYSGAKNFTHNGTSTTFQDMDKMKDALDRLDRQIAKLQSAPRPIAGASEVLSR
jgi:hypothetical protein